MDEAGLWGRSEAKLCGSAGVLFLSIRFNFPSSRGRYHTFPRRGHAAHDELIGGLGGGVRKERGRPTIKPERNGVMWKVNPYANLAGGTSRNLWTYIYETRSDPLGYIDIQTIEEEGWECYICHRCTITMSLWFRGGVLVASRTSYGHCVRISNYRNPNISIICSRLLVFWLPIASTCFI